MSEPRILLEGAREKPLEFFGETALSVDSLGGDPLVSLSPVRMKGTITAIDSEYLVDAEIEFSGELICSRCVATYEFSEELPIHLRLRKRPGPPRVQKARPGAEAEEEREMDTEEVDVVIFEEPVLPFAEIAREQVLMAIPMKPLCREDCRGLCYVCGTDWNAGDCRCEKSPVDQRLEVLKSLK